MFSASVGVVALAIGYDELLRHGMDGELGGLLNLAGLPLFRLQLPLLLLSGRGRCRSWWRQ